MDVLGEWTSRLLNQEGPNASGAKSPSTRETRGKKYKACGETNVKFHYVFPFIAEIERFEPDKPDMDEGWNLMFTYTVHTHTHTQHARIYFASLRNNDLFSGKGSA